MAATDIGIRIVVLGFSEAHRQVGAFRNDMTRLAADIGRTSSSTVVFGRNLVRAGDAMVSFGRTLTFGVSAPIVALTSTLVNAGINFEQAFVGVAKTVDGVSKGFVDVAKEMYGTAEGLTEAQKQAVFANDTFGDLTEEGEKLSKQFVSLSLDIPIAADELARIGQVSGQLGVSADQITDFTETVAKLGVTTDLSSESAAFAIARIGNVMGVETEKMGEFAQQFGAALVSLGNNAAATEPEIVNLSLRLAAAGRIAGLTTPEILGISTAMAEMGVRSERGGTAVSRVIYEMINSISDGGDQLKTFAQIAGLSTQEFANSFQKDALGTLELFITKLADAQDAGKITKDTLLELGLSGIRVREVLNLLGPNIELVRENVDRANYQWQEQIALQEEFIKQSKTVKNQLQLLKNSFVALGVEVLKDLRDDIERMISGIRGLIQGFIDLDPALRKTLLRFGLMASTVGPALLVIGTMTQLLGNSVLGLAKFGNVLKSIVTLPLSPFTGLLGLLSGGGTNKKGGLLGGLTNLIPKPASITGSVRGIVDVFTSTFSKATSPVTKLVSGFVNKVFIGGFSKLVTVPGSIVGFLRSFGSNILSLTFSFLQPNLAFALGELFSKVTYPIQFIVDKVFGSLGSAINKTFGIFGNLITGTVKQVPVLGATLFKYILGPIKAIPSLLALAAGGFTLLFAPKVITQAVKNWDKLLAELKLSFTQFTDDVKKEGLEKAILLFVSGGSTGSGRQGGLLGIAKALGASEEAAKKFSYAMGTATYWVIKIFNSTVDFVKTLFLGEEATDRLGKKVSSTSDRLVALSVTIAQFLEGFFKGWTSSFEEIRDSFDLLKNSISRAVNSFGRLFDSIFGRAEEESYGFYSSLEKGTDSATSRVGRSVGDLLGEIVNLSLLGLTAIVDVVSAVTNAFTSVVEAYKAGGIKGVFEELGPILSGLWSGISEAAGLIWDEVSPKLNTFLSNVSSWFVTDGIPAIALGAQSLWGTLRKGLDEVLFGRDAEFDLIQTGKLSVIDNQTGKEIANLINPSLETQLNYLSHGYTLITDRALQETNPASEGLISKLGAIINDIYGYLSSEDTRQRVADGFSAAFSGINTYILGPLWTNTLEPALNSLWDRISNWFESYVTPRATAAGKYVLLQFANGLLDVVTYSPILDALGGLGLTDEKTISNLLGLDQALNLDVSFQDLLDAELSKVDIISAETKKGFEDSTIGPMQETGRSLIEGIIFGMRDEETVFRDALNTLGIIGEEQLRGALQAQSPSRVFMAIGQDIMLGLIQGMTSYQSYLSSVLNSISSQFDRFASNIIGSTSSIKTQISGLSSTASSTLSTISSSVSNAISSLFGSTASNVTTNSTTNYNTYSPGFTMNGQSYSTIYEVNDAIYQQYLTSQQGVG